MEHYEAVKEYVNHLTEDIRLEAVLAELVGNDVLEIKDISVKPLGLFRRDYRKDVDAIEIIKEGEAESFKSILFSVWREGIYDSLPKGVFHDSKKERGAITKEKREENSKARKKEEKAARDFFFPVEQEFFRQRLKLELLERSIVTGKANDHEINKTFSELWQLDAKGLTPQQILKFQFFLPYCFKYKGDFKALGFLYSALLEEDVQVEIENDFSTPTYIEETPRLGQFFLGDNLVLGNTYYDGLPYVLITVKNLEAAAAANFMPSRHKAILLNLLNDYLLPVELDATVELQLLENEKHLKLEPAKGEAPHFSSILGYTTYL